MTPTITPAASPPLLTADEFIKLHGDESGVELVKGRIVRYPMPGAEHGEVCGNAYALIREVARPNQLGRVMCNDTFIRTGTNPDTYRGADVCFISYARLPKEQPRPKGPLEQAPELVIEVRSPTDRTGDIQIKVGEYLNAGVRVVVVLDPAIDAATVYREADEIPMRIHNGDELIIPDVLPGFSVPVRKFFE
jgi:Uma2 family endonuclease